MTNLPGNPISFWLDSTPETNFPSLSNNILVDVAIVGGGIVGLTAALLLKRAGKSVAVIESKRICTGVSGYTTAKVTSLHRLIYAELIANQGENKARIYAESNQAALEQVARFIEQDNINCDFSRRSAYTFTESTTGVSEIEKEVEAAIKLGLPASFVQETSLPFPIAGAVKFDNQVEFHCRKYLLHFAQSIAGDNSHIFENTRIVKIEEGAPCQVIAENGQVVRAKDVIVATHLPILDQGLFFAKTYPKRSYVVGAYIEQDKAPEGMFISSDQQGQSIRTTPTSDGLLLLIGGGDHKVGAISNTKEKYLELKEYAYSRFGAQTFAYRWSTHDMMSFDKLPFIGKLTPLNQHIYVATGFSAWGMTQGTMSAMILSDLILGIDNPWAKLYDATRATPFFTPEGIKQTLDVGRHWIGDRLKGTENTTLAAVANGEGKLVTIEEKKLAAYRDDQGTLHTVSAVCPHLGCLVAWNNAEKSWDCPCHASRFDCDGNVLHGPALKSLEAYP